MLATYTFWDVIWTMIIFFIWVMFVTWVVMLMIDNFRRTDHSGWAKAPGRSSSSSCRSSAPSPTPCGARRTAGVRLDRGLRLQAARPPRRQLRRLNAAPHRGSHQDAEFADLKERTIAVS